MMQWKKVFHRLSFVTAAVLTVALFGSQAQARGVITDPVLNEFVADHTGTDTDEFVEVFGDPNTDYSALTIVEIEGDWAAPA